MKSFLCVLMMMATFSFAHAVGDTERGLIELPTDYGTFKKTPDVEEIYESSRIKDITKRMKPENEHCFEKIDNGIRVDYKCLSDVAFKKIFEDYKKETEVNCLSSTNS